MASAVTDTTIFENSWQNLFDLVETIDDPENRSVKWVYCVDEKTRCLTSDGWKYFWELEPNELIVSYDKQTDSFRLEEPMINSFDYKGQMIRINHRKLQALFTPHHKILARGRTNKKEKILEAKNLTESYDLPLASRGFFNRSKIRIGDNMLSLLGWISTEGHFHVHSGISIYQSMANENYVKEIRNLLNDLNLDYSIHERMRKLSKFEQFEFYIKRSSANEIKKFMENKHIHSHFIFALNQKQRKLLFTTLIKGDGYKKEKLLIYTQKCQKCAESVQILTLLNGYAARVKKRKKRNLFDTVISGHKFACLRNKQNPTKTISTFPYEGRVWCPTTKTGFWLAERDGYSFITGNSAFPHKRFKDESAYPIVIIQPLNFTSSDKLTMGTSRQVEVDLNVEINIFTLKASQIDTISDDIFDKLETSLGTLWTNKLKNVIPLRSRYGHFERSGMRVHFKSMVYGFEFDYS